MGEAGRSVMCDELRVILTSRIQTSGHLSLETTLLIVDKLKTMYCQEISWYTVYYCRIKHKLSKPKSAMQIITQRCWSENCLSGFKLTIFLQKKLIDQMTSSHYFVPFFLQSVKSPAPLYPKNAGRISQGTQKYWGAEKFVLFFKVPTWHWSIVKLCTGLKNCISNQCSQRVLEAATSSDSETENL